MKRSIILLRQVMAALRPSAPAQATRGLTPGERYDRRQMLHNMARREQSLAALGDDYCLSPDYAFQESHRLDLEQHKK